MHVVVCPSGPVFTPVRVALRVLRTERTRFSESLVVFLVSCIPRIVIRPSGASRRNQTRARARGDCRARDVRVAGPTEVGQPLDRYSPEVDFQALPCRLSTRAFQTKRPVRPFSRGYGSGRSLAALTDRRTVSRRTRWSVGIRPGERRRSPPPLPLCDEHLRIAAACLLRSLHDIRQSISEE